MTDDLLPPSFLRPEGRRRVCMFSIMMERGRKAREYESLGVEEIFARLGHGRYPDEEADDMRGWLGHIADGDTSRNLSERLEEIETRHTIGRRRHRIGLASARVTRLGLPLLVPMVLAALGLLLMARL